MALSDFFVPPTEDVEYLSTFPSNYRSCFVKRMALKVLYYSNSESSALGVTDYWRESEFSVWTAAAPPLTT